ncbi:hypothetical protein PR002_g8522 [Phytophthora rubi]|uniref:Retrotransposon gag domain-containing protein n=1 Tax=Phytophthora rubi TaxID=129364 RepID=A0A6A3MLM5_9STRA|nr:hypothetical protein PR002_g8522 [Phytophthora rubi]
MAAMTTDVQQLTAMVARLQPQSTGDRAHQGGQPVGSRSTQAARTPGTAPGGDGGGSPDSSDDGGHDIWSSSSSSSSSNSNAESESSDSEAIARRSRQARRERRRQQPVPLRKSVKDLELPTFAPSAKTSVSTWIDLVDLALKGAEESGRGKWSDKALYFIMGNKLVDDAAKWWVNMNRRLPERKRTWTNLKKALLRHYAEKLDKSAA